MSLGILTSFWSRLQGRYQQERVKGGYTRADPRASEWQTWTAQWLDEFKGYGEETRLHEVVSPAAPYFMAQNALMSMHKQLVTHARFLLRGAGQRKVPAPIATCSVPSTLSRSHTETPLPNWASLIAFPPRSKSKALSPP